MNIINTVKGIVVTYTDFFHNEKNRRPKKIKAPDMEKEDLLYEHHVITIEEEMINRLLRARLRKHWFFYSIIFEFEPNNSVYIGIISRLGSVMGANFTIEDLWFDDYATSFEIKLDVNTIDCGYFIFNSLIHFAGKWTMSFLGTFFNPFSLGERGSTMRFEKNGVIRFDLVPDSEVRDVIPLPHREEVSVGPVLMYNPRTTQAALQMDYYAFKQKENTFEVVDVPDKTSWLHSIDIAALLLLPMGVWISFIILHHYLPTRTIEFSWSFYFWISVGILVFSFLVMNIPRYVYMYFDNRKSWQSVFIHKNTKIQMRRLYRRILNQQAKLRAEGAEPNSDYQGRIRDLLLQIRDKRFLMQRLKLADEDRRRKQKIKFVIAYVGCTFIEWMLLIN